MKAGEFVIRGGSLGVERCVVNGVDVTDLVEDASVVWRHGQAERVWLGLRPGVSPGEIKGEGVIEVQPAGDGAEAVAKWLANIDEGEVERLLAKRLSMMPMSQRGSPVASVLAVLRELAG